MKNFKFKELANAYNLLGLLLVSLSVWNVFTGIDAADSPYHLFHYKTKVVSTMAFLSGLAGVYLVKFIESIGEIHNTMILLRIINWGLIFFPFIWALTFKFSQVRSNTPIFLILLSLTLPTNWNTLCWDSWNRLYWFVVLIVLFKNLSNKTFKYPVLIGLLTLVGVGIKVTNIFTMFLIVAMLGMDLAQNRLKLLNVKQVLYYLGVTLFGIALFIVYQESLIEFYELEKYITEIDNGSHDLFSLFISSFKHALLFLLIKCLVFGLTRKNAFETYEGMGIFITTTILCASFYSFHNSIIALLVIFLYVEFILFQIGKLDWKVLTVLILVPFFYAAGSDTGLFKAYWVVPQTLLFLFFLDERTILDKKFVYAGIPKFVATISAVLSVSTLMGNELYKSSLMPNCIKSLDIVPFNNINVSYYDKIGYKKMGDFAMKNWDYNPNRTNIVLGSTSFLFANAILFKNWDTIPQNYYIFRTIHTDLNGASAACSAFNKINDLDKDKEVSNIFYFGGLNEDSDLLRNPEMFDVKLIEKEGHMYIFKYLGNGKKQ